MTGERPQRIAELELENSRLQELASVLREIADCRKEQIGLLERLLVRFEGAAQYAATIGRESSATRSVVDRAVEDQDQLRSTMNERRNDP